MNPVIFTIVGIVVALLILAWGVFEVSRRYFTRKKVTTRPINTWVPLKTTTTDVSDKTFVAKGDREDSPANHHNTKAQQNGHYSASKRKL